MMGSENDFTKLVPNNNNSQLISGRYAKKETGCGAATIFLKYLLQSACNALSSRASVVLHQEAFSQGVCGTTSYTPLTEPWGLS